MASTFRGLAFPFRIGKTSVPEVATGAALIEQSIIQLIMTGAGERCMRPNVGSHVHKYVFENNDELLAEMIRADITATIVQNEPRVMLREITVTKGADTSTPTADGQAFIKIKISYVILLTKQAGTVSIDMPVGQG